MGEIAILHGISFPLELLHDGCHVDGIPDDDSIGDDVETQRLMGQGLAPAVAELAFVRHHHKGPEVVERLTFVELAEKAAPLLWVGIPPEDMQSSGEAAVLLERARQRILLRMGLELLDEE
jgi:hypothetical protein